MPNKTIEQYQAEIDALRRAAAIPGVPDDEKAIYAETIRRIESKIIDLHRAAPAAPAPTATPPQQPKPTPRKEELPPIPITVIKAGQRREASRPSQPDNAPIAANTPPSPLGGGAGGGARIAGVIVADRKTVLIDWGAGRTDTLTEGEARGRFTTALRDLAESRMVRLGRLEDIRQYITFDRAVTYYRALTEFWLSPPTPQQLQIWPLSKVRSEIFELIQTTAAQQ